MKKFLLSIFAVLFAFAGVQAQEVVLDFTTNDWGFPAARQTTKQTFTNSEGYSITLEAPNGYNYNSQNYLLFGKNGATLTLPVFDFAVSKIEIVGRGGASSAVKEVLYADGTLLTTFTGAVNTNTYKVPEADQVAGIVYSIKVESNHNAQITKINIYKAADADEPVVTPPAAPTLPEETSFTDDEFVVEITNNADNAIVYYSLNNENDWVEGSTVTIYETTTVYAKAVDANDNTNESKVVSAKYTKVDLPDAGEAAVVTGNAAVNYGTATINTIEKFEVAPVTLTFAKNDGQTQPAYNKAGDCRIYAKGSITATCSAGNLTKIVFVVSDQGKKRLTDLTPSTGMVTIADDHSTVTWEGNAAKVVMTVGDQAVYGTDGSSKAGQICFTEFTATYVIPSSSYTLTVGETGYATLFLDFAAAIPAGVEAYTVTAVNNGYVTLTQVKGAMPANTGVIVKAGQGDYTFAYSTDEAADVTGNLLKGTVTDKNIEGEAYVLGVVDGEVGLYKALANGTSWLNNANKAYLPMPAGAEGIKSFSFRFEGEGTTAIENVEVENEVKAIYDLTGRKVNEITAPGIYIVNGVKRVVR